ncbi:MAG: BatD family protein [Bacteroidota bacterium]
MQNKYRSLILLLIAGILLTPAVARAQKLSATATLDTSSITTGEAVQLDIAVEGTTLASEPVIESIDGLEISSLGRSSRVNIINGKYTALINYSYEIIGLKPGSYTLGPFEIKVKNEKVTANAVTLQVNGTVSQGETKTRSVDNSSPLGDKLFMEMELGKGKLFLGEKTPLKIRVYYSEINIDEMSYPVINQTEFILDQMNKPSQRRTTINGRSYQVVEFSTNLSPIRTGKFKLGPAQLNCSVLIKQQEEDSFFARFRKYPLELKSNQVNINVLPLPSGEPANFSGGIGRFQIQVSGQPTEVLQGEPITLRMTVTGNGNLQAVSAPQLKNVKGLKIYDAQKKKSDQGATGQVQFEQVVIPVDPKVKEIGPFQFGYFDPFQGKYRQATAPAIPVKVNPNPNFNAVLIADSDESKENYGRDLVYIKEQLGSLKRRNEGLIYQNWFWWLQLIPLLGLGIALGYRKYRRILLSDSPWSRAVRAGNRAVKRLAKAKAELTVKPENTLENLHLIIREYLGEKYGLTTAGMTGTVVEQIAGFGINPETLQEIKEFFDQYDYYRFTGNKIDSTEAGRLWEQVNRIIKNLDQGDGLINKKGKAPERRGQSERL